MFTEVADWGAADEEADVVVGAAVDDAPAPGAEEAAAVVEDDGVAVEVAGAGASVVFFLRPLCDDSTNEDRRNVYTHFLGAKAEVVALSLVVREPALSSAFVFLQVRVRQRAVNVHQRKKRFT